MTDGLRKILDEHYIGRAKELEELYANLVNHKVEQEKILSSGYPAQVEELAALVGQKVEAVDQVIGYICNHYPVSSRYQVVGILLAFHRTFAYQAKKDK